MFLYALILSRGFFCEIYQGIRGATWIDGLVGSCWARLCESTYVVKQDPGQSSKEGANKQVISSQADSLIKISRIWADFFPANTSNQPI
ncbi:hypothetical protein NUBL21995_46670 [Klebsiella pneumoniae]|nr:hypothetical protein NUBL21995_46670 [Klebsiella pneumoniae]